jgi:hypothetical protein
MNGARELITSGGYVYLAASECPTLKIPVESADMASAMFQQYRDRNAIGASDMKPHCGSIFTDDGTLVANVSYNGRVWTPEGLLLQGPPEAMDIPPARRRSRKRGPLTRLPEPTL